MTGFMQFDTGLTGWEGPSVAECRPVICDSNFSPKPAENPVKAVKPPPPVASVATVAGWRDGIERLKDLPRPDFVQRHDWKGLVSDAVMLATTWADVAFEQGWTLAEIFGVPPRPWERRFDPCGVIYLLAGNHIGSVDRNCITIIQPDGRPLNFRRHDPAMNIPWDRSGALPIWQAFSPENIACR